MNNFKSFPKDMPEWQTIQDEYNKMQDQADAPLFVQPSELSSAELADGEILTPTISELAIPAVNTAPTPAVRNQTQQVQDIIQPVQPPMDEQQPAMSSQEQLLAEFKRMREADQKALDEARSSDRMLKMGGAIGDALATVINARSQMNVKAPGVQVQQGAGLGKIADMFQTSPEMAADVKARREDLMNQLNQMRLMQSSKANRDLQERKIKAYEDQVRNRKTESGLTPYQEFQQQKADQTEVRKMSADIAKSGLPKLMESIKTLEQKLGMSVEEAVARNNDTDSSNDVDLPGYGRFSSAFVPDALTTDEGREMRQLIQGIENPDISEQFGATQAVGEIERYKKAVGTGKFESVDAVLRGLSNIKKGAAADIQNIEAGYSPQTIETYQSRGGVTRPSTEETKTVGGKTYKKVPGGWQLVK